MADLQWVTADGAPQVFVPWLNTQGRTPQDAIILLLDGASGHDLSPEMYRHLLEQERILVVKLPPHTTGVLQICDTHLFGVLKINFRNATTELGTLLSRDNWLKTFLRVG
jgi:hypothetical protein